MLKVKVVDECGSFSLADIKKKYLKFNPQNFNYTNKEKVLSYGRSQLKNRNNNWAKYMLKIGLMPR